MGKKLLVADDSLTIQKVIKLALSGDNYEIQTVSDGNDALQQISIFHPDAVLIDVGIPGRSAFDVKKAMNEDNDFKSIPVILMSSAFEKVDEAKVALLQFEGRLTKPFDPTHLRQALSQALSIREGSSFSDHSSFQQDEPSLQFTKEPTREIFREPTREIQRPVSRSFPEEEKTKTFSTITNSSQFSKNLKSTPSEITSSILNQVKAPLPKLEIPTSISIPFDSPTSVTVPEIDLEPLQAATEEIDIKNLTESTMRMSHLDEFDSWNIDEKSNQLDSPHIDLNQKEVIDDSFLDNHKINFDFEDQQKDKNDFNFSDIVPPKFDQTKTNLKTLAPTQLNIQKHSDSYESLEPSKETFQPSQQSPQFKMEDLLQNEEIKRQIEEMVQLRVEKTLETMAKKGLPDIAEKVIRQEIRKILETLH